MADSDKLFLNSRAILVTPHPKTLVKQPKEKPELQTLNAKLPKSSKPEPRSRLGARKASVFGLEFGAIGGLGLRFRH